MPITIYIISAASVLFFTVLLSMAGLGGAFLFVPLFYYLGVPLDQATPTALLVNVVSMLFATLAYWRGKLINWRIGLPILVAAVIFSPIGALLTRSVDKTLLLGMFAAFLVFAGWMMLFKINRQRENALSRTVEISAGLGMGSVAGFFGGMLGLGGGNFILPFLNWLGLETRIAVGTTSLVVIFCSLSGFLTHATLVRLDPLFIGIIMVMAAVGSSLGSHLMKTKVSNAQLKIGVGILLWLIAIKMIIDLFKV